MDKLEELLKSSGHGEQPAVASREGFGKMLEALEKQVEGPTTSKRNRRLVVLFFLFSAIAIAGWYAWPLGTHDLSGEEIVDVRLEKPLGDDHEASRIIPTAESNDKRKNSPSVSGLPIADEQSRVKEQKVDEYEQTGQNGKENADFGKKQAALAESKVGEDGIRYLAGKTVVFDAPKIKSGLEEQKSTLVYPLPRIARYPLPERIQTSGKSSLGMSLAGKSAGIYVPDVPDISWNRSKYELVDKGQAYWTIGGTVLGQRSEWNNPVERWESNPVAGNSYFETFPIDGRQTLLYYDGYEQKTKSNTDVIGMLQLRRQTSKSLFFGIGGSQLNQKRSSIKLAQELRRDSDVAYYQAWASHRKYFLFSATVGFTFLRSRRLQPWIGVDANFPLATSTKYSVSFVEGATGNVYLQSESTQTGYRADLYPKVFPSIQFGVRGQLSRRFRIGVTGGFVPTDIDVDMPFAGGLDLHYIFGR